MKGALQAFERALALRKQGHDRRGEANTTRKIAVLRHAFGQDGYIIIRGSHIPVLSI